MSFAVTFTILEAPHAPPTVLFCAIGGLFDGVGVGVGLGDGVGVGAGAGVGLGQFGMDPSFRTWKFVRLPIAS